MKFRLLLALASLSTVLAGGLRADETSGSAPASAVSASENERSGAVAHGFPGVISIEASGDARTVAARRVAAVEKATISKMARKKLERQLRAMRVLGPRTPLSRPRIAAYTRDGALPEPTTSSSSTSSTTTRSTTRAVSPLRFKFTGFTSRQITEFQAFRDKAYPLMTALYGDPVQAQQNCTVEVRLDASAGDGLYELPPARSSGGCTTTDTNGGTIRYDPITGDSSLSNAEALRINEYNLARQMLIAFHGAKIFAFDAWELGFSDAAALVLSYQLHPSSTFDPSSLGVYLLPIYDLLNRPELGNPFFFSQGTSPNLGFYRAGMAQAAWLKVWVENRDFFRRMNTGYYARLGSSPSIGGDTPALKAVAASIVPTIEGLNFADWYRRQFVLDTAITTGEKLWLAVVPQPNLTSGDTRSVFFGIAQRYRTYSNGDERPISGSGTIGAFNENNVNISTLSEELQNDGQAIFNSLGESELNSQNVPVDEIPVIGFTGTGTPEQARIRIVVVAGEAQSEAIFPYGVAGTTNSPSGFYGAVVNGTKGSISIATTNRTSSRTLARGAFADGSAYPSAQAVKTRFTLTPTDGAAAKSFFRNGAWSYYGGQTQSLAVILETAPGNAAVNASWNISGVNKWRMISLPLFPTESDEATVLGIDRTLLQLARYRPNLPAPRTTVNSIAFGITSQKHELYPNIAEPFTPGRGYWLQLNANLATTVRGGEPTRARPYEVPLLGGWNQIGVPYNRGFTTNSLRVVHGTTSMPLATAISTGVICAGVWRWKASGGYDRVDYGDTTNQTLQPFEGIYIYSRPARGVKLVFDAATTSQAVIKRAAVSTQNWRVPMVATATSGSTVTGRDDDAGFGVTGTTNGILTQRPAARPPAGPRSLTLAFSSSGDSASDATNAGAPSGWAESLLKPNSTMVWNGFVDGTAANETVTLAWGSFSALPVSLNATFIDLLTNTRIDMTKQNRYSFVSNGKSRIFRIEAAPRSAGIQSFKATTLSGSRSVQIDGTFSISGQAIIEIETPDGELVVGIGNRAVAVGTSTWFWSGKDASRAPAPAGNYVARLYFRDANGHNAQATAAFVLPQ
ncbi:MAG TPA: hypothetical protein VF681_04075 [Abditibacteriaceae bacterium]|jgi:hypothetical protein